MSQRPLTEGELNHLKSILEKERDRLIFKDIYLSDEFNLHEGDRADEVDQAAADAGQAERLRFRNREVFYAKKISEALKRIEKGTYGVCQDCDEPIGYTRLLARPTAELCIVCKEESEREESLSIVGRQSKSLGKQIDLVRAV